MKPMKAKGVFGMWEWEMEMNISFVLSFIFMFG